MGSAEKFKRKNHPRDKASWFSLLTYSFILGLFRKAFKKDLHEDDLFEVPEDIDVKKCGNELELAILNVKRKKLNPSLLRILWYRYKLEYCLIMLPYLCMKIVRSIYEPELISGFISYFKDKQTDVTFADAIYYNVSLMGILFFYSMTMGVYNLTAYHFYIKIRSAVSSLIFRKTLKLSLKGVSEMSVGNTVTLMTKDVAILENGLKFSQDFFVSICQLIASSTVLYIKVGPISWIAILFIFVIIGLEILIGKYITIIRVFIDNKTSERIKAIKDTLASLKVIKMLSWEKFFFNKISAIRRVEVNSLLKDAYAKSTVIILGTLSPDLMIYILIMSHIWMDLSLKTEIVFYIITCVKSIKMIVSFLIPHCLGTIADFRGCLRRIDKMLEAEELQERIDQFSDELKILMRNVSVKMHNKDILTNISVNFPKGITTITGAIGSGKSTLLLSILKELPYTGFIITSGRISYASPEPWLFPSTIKQNIIFEEDFNSKRYQEILRICCLKNDLERLKDGDETIIVNGGLNFSKGQQSRINLARAIYRDSEIYLLDDCLSVLDSQIQQHICRELTKGWFRNKICLIVTQNGELVRNSDRVLVLKNNGVDYFGSPISDEENVYQKILNSEENCNNLVISNDDQENFTEDQCLLTTTSDIYKEKQIEGNVPFIVYRKYIKFGRGFISFIFIWILFVISQFSDSLSSKTLTQWVDIEQKKITATDNATKFSEISNNSSYTIQIYSGLIFLSVVITLLKIYFLYDFTKTASIRISKELTSKILNSTLSFIDTHFFGNILNRFSQDLSNIDENIPMAFLNLFRAIVALGGILFIISIVDWKLLIVTLVLLLMLMIWRKLYMPAARSLKRLEIASRSPFIGHINATLDGIKVIRAHGVQKQQQESFETHYNFYISTYYTYAMSQLAFAFYLDIICLVFVFAMLWGFLLLLKDLSAGNLGLAIIQLFSIRNHVAVCFRFLTDTEVLMTSVERILEYTDLEQEVRKGVIIEDWPKEGSIKFENVTMSYSKNCGTLKNINFEINSGQKVGIIGRTGSGKSSLIYLILRLYDFEGKITIDNKDIKSISLDYLRQHIDIIPQDPTLFSDTIRNNLDPLNLYKDEDIWAVISKINMKNLVPNLYDQIDPTEFSAGEKQLLCLARAMLRKNKILIMDEATAHVDLETERFLIEIINEHFADYTVINIAHKQQSVRGYKIFKLEKGEICEYYE